MHSLTGILYKGVLLGVSIVFLAAGAGLYFAVKIQMVRQLDGSLAERVDTLASSIEYKPYGLEADLEEMGTGEIEVLETPDYLSIALPDGRILYRSVALEGALLPEMAGEPEEEIYSWVNLADGRRTRSILYSFVPELDDEEAAEQKIPEDPVAAGIALDTGIGPGQPVSIQLFRDFSAIEQFLRSFLMMLLFTGVCSIAVLAYTVRAAIKRGARPINDLARSIDAIRDDDLTVRVHEGKAPRELVPVVARLNGLLERLEKSFSREKAFTSDAAHELRTPLAGLRSTLEVALNKKRENEEYRETLNRVLGIVGHMEALVAKLLILARLESGQRPLSRAPVSLEDKVADAWAKHSVKAGERRIEVLFDLGGTGSVLTDPDFLESVLDEVFGNAVSYSNDGGSIAVTAASGVETKTLRIENTGSRVASTDAGRVFDRFWRGSLSRSDTGRRFGLGLPIARMMTEAMGGRLDIETESGEVFRVTLNFPAAEGDEGAGV